jgi:phage tail sheath protein FI
MPFQLSPGVAVVEKDFTSIIPAVATSVGAFAGMFEWGPVEEPITISSEDELVRRFGYPQNNNFESFYTAANFLSYSNNILLVREKTASMKNAVGTPTGSINPIVCRYDKRWFWLQLYHRSSCCNFRHRLWRVGRRWCYASC